MFSRYFVKFIQSLVRASHPLGVVLVSVSFWGVSVTAQTRFEEPSGLSGVAQYRTVEQCWAQKDRLSILWEGRDSILYDTMPPKSTLKRMMPWPRHIIEAVALCTEKWDAKTVSLTDFYLLGELLLVAGRKDDFLILLERKIEESKINEKNHIAIAIGSSNDEIDSLDGEKDHDYGYYKNPNQVYSDVIKLYGNARPVHIAELDSLVTRLISLPNDSFPRTGKIDLLWRLRQEVAVYDSAIAMRAAVRADALFAELNDEERKGVWYTHPRFGSVLKAKLNSSYLHSKERLDSLRVSSAAYVNSVRQQEAGILNGVDPTRDPRFEIGATSPSVDGDFWFPLKPTSPRPTVGKLSFVIPLTICRAEWGAEMRQWRVCLKMVSMLQRVHRQFPDLEITLITHQVGRAILQEPGSAEDEAEDMRRWLLEGFKLPVTLVINKANFVKLPEPDCRLVPTYWTLESMLKWGCFVDYKGRIFCSYPSFLIDESGLILGTNLGEGDLVDMLTILSHRNR